MKYVRTNDDNIYEIEASIILTSMPPQYKVLNNSNVYSIQCNETIKESDNIEDLLDGYVVRNELVRYLDIAKAYSKEFGEPVYGAIWTDKGLIYIAKLTEKGWELLWK